MATVREHREARGERETLPEHVREEVGVMLAVLGVDPWARRVSRERVERLTGWGRRVMLVYRMIHRGVHYRMAWEVESASRVIIWAYGPHEGFYARLERRGRR